MPRKAWMARLDPEGEMRNAARVCTPCTYRSVDTRGGGFSSEEGGGSIEPPKSWVGKGLN